MLEPNSASSGGVSHAETVAQIGEEIKGIKESARLDEVRGLCHRMIEFMGKADSDGYQQCIDAMVATRDTRMGVLRHIVKMASTGNESDAFLAQTKQIVCDILSHEQRTEQHQAVSYEWLRIAATHHDVSPAFLSMTQEIVLKIMAQPNSKPMKDLLLTQLFSFAANAYEGSSTEPTGQAFVNMVGEIAWKTLRQSDDMMRHINLLGLQYRPISGASDALFTLTRDLYGRIITSHELGNQHKSFYLSMQATNAQTSHHHQQMILSKMILTTIASSNADNGRKHALMAPYFTVNFFSDWRCKGVEQVSPEYRQMLLEWVRDALQGSGNNADTKAVVFETVIKALSSQRLIPELCKELSDVLKAYVGGLDDYRCYAVMKKLDREMLGSKPSVPLVELSKALWGDYVSDRVSHHIVTMFEGNACFSYRGEVTHSLVKDVMSRVETKEEKKVELLVLYWSCLRLVNHSSHLFDAMQASLRVFFESADMSDRVKSEMLEAMCVDVHMDDPVFNDDTERLMMTMAHQLMKAIVSSSVSDGLKETVRTKMASTFGSLDEVIQMQRDAGVGKEEKEHAISRFFESGVSDTVKSLLVDSLLKDRSVSEATKETVTMSAVRTIPSHVVGILIDRMDRASASMPEAHTSTPKLNGTLNKAIDEVVANPTISKARKDTLISGRSRLNGRGDQAGIVPHARTV